MATYNKRDLGLLDRVIRFSHWREMEHLRGANFCAWYVAHAIQTTNARRREAGQCLPSLSRSSSRQKTPAFLTEIRSLHRMDCAFVRIGTEGNVE